MAERKVRSPKVNGEVSSGVLGREQFVEQVMEALRPGRILRLHGVAGIGKSTILRELARALRAELRSFVELDASTSERQTVLSAIDEAAQRQAVIVVDGWEHLDGGDGFVLRVLRDLPKASFILAGREPAAAAVLAGPGGASIVACEVGPLRRSDARALLESRLLTSSHRSGEWQAASIHSVEAILARAHGHPLSLVLLAHGARAGEDEPRTLEALLDSFLRGFPIGSERQALETLAFFSVANEEAFEACLGKSTEEASRLFAFLRSLPFVRSTPRGLVLHEALADALRRDVVWRRPEASRALILRVVDFADRLLAPSESASRRTWGLDLLLFLVESAPRRIHGFVPAPFSPSVAPLRKSEQAEARALLHVVAGPRSAALFSAWLAKGARAVVTRDEDDRIDAVALLADIADLTQAPEEDPLIDVLRATESRQAKPWRVLRFAHHREEGFLPHLSVSALLAWFSRENIACPADYGYALVPDDVEAWAPFAAVTGDHYRSDLTFELDGRTLTPFVLTGGLSSTANAVRRVHRAGAMFAWGLLDTQTPEKIAVTSELVLAALPHLRDTTSLSKTALATALALSGEELQARLFDLIERTRDLKHGGDVYRALRAAYFEGGANQQDAMDRAAMSLSTYKRRKQEGVASIVAKLAAG